MAEQLQLASFTQEAMLKILNFVDFIIAPNLTCQVVFVADGVGVPVSCGGPGVVPGVGVDLFRVVPSPCSYWWRRSSGFDGDGVSGVRLQVEWDVGWVAWDGSAGSSPPLRVSTTDTVTVQEIQVLITN